MGTPFSDISLYLPTPQIVGTPEYDEELAIENFVSDLYVRKMNGYKPPKTSRITIQPAFHEIWKRTWKNGSIVTIAPYYNYCDYAILDKKGKYKYILDLIHRATLQLSDEYNWNRNIFENAYKEVLKNDFVFKIEYPQKTSRDKQKVANLLIEKTETITSVYVVLNINTSSHKVKLFDKKNLWWYDSVYLLAKYNKWFDNNRFGIRYTKRKIDTWYSIEKNEVELFINGNRVIEIDFKKFFLFG